MEETEVKEQSLAVKAVRCTQMMRPSENKVDQIQNGASGFEFLSLDF